MERCLIIVNSWKPLTIFTKRSILDVAARSASDYTPKIITETITETILNHRRYLSAKKDALVNNIYSYLLSQAISFLGAHYVPPGCDIWFE